MGGENKTLATRLWRICRMNLLVVLTILGVIVGLTVGLSVRKASPSQDALLWIGLPGEVYMRMLRMMILPLIICSVITGTASLNPRSQGRISIVAVVYIFVANFVPAVIGAAMVLIIRPGYSSINEKPTKTTDREVMETMDIFADLIRNLFPDNLVTATFQQTITKYSVEEVVTVLNSTNVTTDVVTKYLGSASGTNILGLIICCTLFGVATSSVGALGQPFLSFFCSASEIILRILQWLIWTTPVGVASLIGNVLAKTQDLEQTFSQLGLFILSSLIGLFILMYVVIPITFFVIYRKNPFRFFLNLVRPLIVTFATASTAIAIPDTLHVMETQNQIDKRIARFVVPFSSALNKSGSALYIASSCLFAMQIEHLPIDAGNVFLIIVLTALSTFAVPAVPSAGIVTILILLTSMNISTEPVGLLLAIEWFMDRCRTSGNLYSQNLCVAMVQRYSNLPPIDDGEKTLADQVNPDITLVLKHTREEDRDEVVVAVVDEDVAESNSLVRKEKSNSGSGLVKIEV